MAPISGTSAPAQKGGTLRDRLLICGLCILVLVGLIGLAAATGWEETVEAMRRLSVGLLAALLALSLVNYGFRAARWHLFSARLGLGTTWIQSVRHYVGGFAMSVTPGRVGELVRMRWIARETGWSFDRTAPLVLADRASDLAAMAALLALALMFSATGVSGAAPVAILALTAAFVVTRPALLRATAHAGHRLSNRKLPRLFARVRRAADSLGTFAAPGTFLLAALLGLIGWLAEGYAFYILLDHLGAGVGFWLALGIFIFATLAGGLTGAPGGLGGAEAAMVALLTLDGVPMEIAIPATLVIRITTLWFAIGLGLAVFPLAERTSKKAHHALQDN